MGHSRCILSLMWALCVLVLPGPLSAQESAGQGHPNRDPEPDILPDSPRSQDDLRSGSQRECISPALPSPRRWGLGAEARWSLLSDNDAASRFAGYDDLFHDGFGASLVLSYNVLATSDVVAGPYLSIGVDRFGGGSASGSDARVGTAEVDAEDLTVWTALLGVELGTHTRGDEGGFFAQAKVGGGLAHFDSVEADVFFATGNQRFSGVSWYESTTTWATEATARVGWGGRNWTFFVGAGIRLLGAPDGGDTFDVDPGTFETYPIETGIEIRF